MRQTKLRTATTTASVLALVLTLMGAGSAGTKIIYSFGGDTDGEYIDSDLVMDSSGNIYGTSVQGGAFGGGTVFELSPSQGSWSHTVLPPKPPPLNRCAVDVFRHCPSPDHCRCLLSVCISTEAVQMIFSAGHRRP